MEQDAGCTFMELGQDGVVLLIVLRRAGGWRVDEGEAGVQARRVVKFVLLLLLLVVVVVGVVERVVAHGVRMWVVVNRLVFDFLEGRDGDGERRWGARVVYAGTEDSRQGVGSDGGSGR